MLKYKAAATQIALNLLSTVLREMDELRPLEVAPLTTLLSNIAVTRVGKPNLEHLWANLKTTASSRMLIWDSFLKDHEVSTLQSPDTNANTFETPGIWKSFLGDPSLFSLDPHFKVFGDGFC